jgi:hypothetical protein
MAVLPAPGDPALGAAVTPPDREPALDAAPAPLDPLPLPPPPPPPPCAKPATGIKSNAATNMHLEGYGMASSFPRQRSSVLLVPRNYSHKPAMIFRERERIYELERPGKTLLSVLVAFGLAVILIIAIYSRW